MTQSTTAAAPRRRSISKALRWLVIVIAALAASVIARLAYCEYYNSRDVPPPSEAELREHFERAATWMFANERHISTENNPMLWVFINEAGKLTGNAREDPQVLALLATSGCNPHMMWLRSPWCHTHQLMGLRFVQKNHCEPDDETARTVEAVQNSILTELRWDFRVEDAYLQKVMTLLESGRRKDIKPIWIKRILEAQRADGGWDGIDMIAHLPGNRVLAWEGGRLYPWPRTLPESNLHATAQGLYLLALLLKPE